MCTTKAATTWVAQSFYRLHTMHTHARRLAHIHTHAHMCVHARAHTHTHTHMRAQVAREAIPALVELKNAGLVRAVGFSGLPLNMFNKVLDQADPGGPGHPGGASKAQRCAACLEHVHTQGTGC